jgi:ribosome-binding factor A
MSRRAQKLSEEIKREASQILRYEIKDPRVSNMLSITRVEVSKDLSHAKIYVSLLGNDQTKKNALDGLERAKGFIRRELGKRLTLRFVPEIAFFMDTSIEHGAYINQLIEKLMKGEGNEGEDDNF